MNRRRGINRNIVECKGRTTTFASSLTASINRNIVECKEDGNAGGYGQILVLIETLWNVKSKRCSNRKVMFEY